MFSRTAALALALLAFLTLSLVLLVRTDAASKPGASDNRSFGCGPAADTAYSGDDEDCGDLPTEAPQERFVFSPSPQFNAPVVTGGSEVVCKNETVDFDVDPLEDEDTKTKETRQRVASFVDPPDDCDVEWTDPPWDFDSNERVEGNVDIEWHTNSENANIAGNGQFSSSEPGTYQVWAVATDPAGENSGRKDSDRESEKVSITVLPKEAGEWYNIQMPNINNQNGPPQSYFTPIIREPDPISGGTWEYQRQGQILFVADIVIKGGWNTGQCNEEVSHSYTLSVGMEAGVSVYGINISNIVGISRTVQREVAYGSTGSHKRYRFRIHQPVWHVKDNRLLWLRRLVIDPNNPPEWNQRYNNDTFDIRTVGRDGADYEVEAACCPTS